MVGGGFGLLIRKDGMTEPSGSGDEISSSPGSVEVDGPKPSDAVAVGFCGAGEDSMSMLQPALVPSTSKPSRMTRILPQESQFGGIKILSRSMTLCFRVCFFSRE